VDLEARLPLVRRGLLAPRLLEVELELTARLRELAALEADQETPALLEDAELCQGLLGVGKPAAQELQAAADARGRDAAARQTDQDLGARHLLEVEVGQTMLGPHRADQPCANPRPEQGQGDAQDAAELLRGVQAAHTVLAVLPDQVQELLLGDHADRAAAPLQGFRGLQRARDAAVPAQRPAGAADHEELRGVVGEARVLAAALLDPAHRLRAGHGTEAAGDGHLLARQCRA
jgi:hypothetical protein